MSSFNRNGKKTDSMELLKQEASACGAGCDCHTDGPMGRKRVILGTIVLLVAAALVARAVVKTNTAPSDLDTTAFALPTVAQTPAAESDSATPAAEVPKAAVPFVAEEIEVLSELNTLAIAYDAVFLYVPGKEGSSSNLPAAALQSAAGTIGAQGYKIGFFALKAGTRDHDQIATQMAVPGVLAAVKGRGMAPVSGDITETKLIQGFVAASSAGGCGTGGSCGPVGCN